LQGSSGLDVPVGPGSQGATVGEPAGVGLGIAEQASTGAGPQGALGAAVGMPQQVRERLMNREMVAAGNTPEQSEAPEAEQESSGLEASDEQGPNATHRPPFISNLIDTGLFTEDQVGDMRSAGAGWGAIRISGLLAGQIAAGSNDEEMTFDTALEGVLGARDEGMGFGQIALMHDLKVGHLLGNGN
jgi:hypothetical protein